MRKKQKELIEAIVRVLRCPTCGTERIITEKYINDWWRKVYVCPECGIEEVSKKRAE